MAKAVVEAGKMEKAEGGGPTWLAKSGVADVAGWGAMLGLALEQTGGPLTAKERAWADLVLRDGPKPKRSGKAA